MTLVNRGSKYWQENREAHVDELEDEFEGPLYKTILSEERFRPFNLTKGYPISVSRVNQTVSLYITVIWLGLFLRSVFDQPWLSSFGQVSSCLKLVSTFDWPALFLLVITLTCVIHLNLCCKTERRGKPVIFEKIERGLSGADRDAAGG